MFVIRQNEHNRLFQLYTLFTPPWPAIGCHSLTVIFAEVKKSTWEKKVGVTVFEWRGHQRRPRPIQFSTTVCSSCQANLSHHAFSSRDCTCRVSTGPYKWDGEPTTGCNAAPGATVSPPGAAPDGPEAGSPLWGYRARRAAHTGRQIHMQVTT